jgi:DNA-binding winged helix-turn-helix (wHTH) protein
MKRQLLRVGSLALDLERLCVDAGSGPVPLRPKSFDVLRHLMEHAGRVIPKEELIAALWPGVTVSDESLAQCIRDIRRVIGDENKELIRTIPKRGYVIDGPRAATGGALPLATAESAVVASFAGARREQELNAADPAAPQNGQTVRQRSSRRSAILAGLAAALVISAALAVGTMTASFSPSMSSHDGAWQGAMTCDKLPFTTAPLVTHFGVNVSGGRASYSRRVLSPDLITIVGVEEGAGTIDSSGAINLTGGWAHEPHVRLTASYSGILGVHTAELHGSQLHTFRGQDFTRNCSIRLTR